MPQAESWVSGHWNIVADLSDEMANKLTADYFIPYYIPGQTVSEGEYRLFNGYIRKAKADIPSSVTTWTEATNYFGTIGQNISALFNSMQSVIDSKVPLSYYAPFYIPGETYHAGDYVLYNNYIRRAKMDNTDETFISGHWITVGQTVFDMIGEIESIDLVSTKATAESGSVPVERYENIDYIDLLSSQTAIAGANSNTTTSIDKNIRFKNIPYSIKATIASGVDNGTLLITVPAFTMLGTQEFEVYLYVEDASDVGIDVVISGDTVRRVLRLQGTASGMSKYYGTDLHDGWNKIRFITNGSPTDFTKNETQLRLTLYKNSDKEVSFWIGAIYAVKPDKANLIIVDDGPYKTFYDIAYPAFTNIIVNEGQENEYTFSVPITWALDPMLLGDNTDPNRKLISQEEVDVLAVDGISEFSFHNYDGTNMTGASAQAALRDTLNCIRYLKKHGLESEQIFRAAWFHNDCTNPELANEVLDASASYNGSTGFTQFPFPDRYNIPRYAMQGRTDANLDTIFSGLKNQHCTIFMYTHGISSATTDVSTELLAKYVAKIATGVDEGWLNVTTYNRLIRHYKAYQQTVMS